MNDYVTGFLSSHDVMAHGAVCSDYRRLLLISPDDVLTWLLYIRTTVRYEEDFIKRVLIK